MRSRVCRSTCCTRGSIDSRYSAMAFDGHLIDAGDAALDARCDLAHEALA